MKLVFWVKFLLTVSACALLAGLVFPIGAKVSNPFLAYGIVSVSFPTWAIGAIAGGIARHRASHQQPPRLTAAWWGTGLCIANGIAVIATLVIPFYAS